MECVRLIIGVGVIGEGRAREREGHEVGRSIDPEQPGSAGCAPRIGARVTENSAIVVKRSQTTQVGPVFRVLSDIMRVL